MMSAGDDRSANCLVNRNEFLGSVSINYPFIYNSTFIDKSAVFWLILR